jgi:hypothetical protein
MATIYYGTIKTVSPFIALPTSEIKKIIFLALENYKHPASGFRLESTEVHVQIEEPESELKQGILTGLLMARELLKRGGDLDELISLNR